MSYILTVTGKHFDPVEPDEYLIDIYDIAHALSKIILGCLLHDASEAYLSDVTRPVKKDLTRRFYGGI